VATHDVHRVERVADRVGYIYGGELAEIGPPERIFESPDDFRTKRFVDGGLLYGEDQGCVPVQWASRFRCQHRSWRIGLSSPRIPAKMADCEDFTGFFIPG
jgi:ABC-type sulfate/molybdate transport systems ATPase subunit